jgi:hypothetical protein
MWSEEMEIFETGGEAKAGLIFPSSLCEERKSWNATLVLGRATQFS